MWKIDRIAASASREKQKQREKKDLQKKYRRIARKKSDAFHVSDEWRKVRYAALKRSKGCCDCCCARAKKGKPLHVDHIKPRSKHGHLALDLDNLQVLCVDCNMGKGNWDETDWREPLGSTCQG